MSFSAYWIAVLGVAFVGVSQPEWNVDSNLRDNRLSLADQQTETTTWLQQELEDGQAHIWYLGHCGWAIKTRTRLLIFDYWEQFQTSGEKTLGLGRIDPAELAQLDVYVFATHDHGDHYDPRILEWKEEVPNITYIFGWNAGLDPDFTYMADQREVMDFSGMRVSVVNHQFDRIPEVAFLVNVDGITVYHSGDHATIADQPNEVFTDNIDYLANKQDQVDLAFISTFGRRGGAVVNAGDMYTIGHLMPRIVFPMHHGQADDLLHRFANEVDDTVADTEIVAASRLGDHFFYSDGRVSGRR